MIWMAKDDRVQKNGKMDVTLALPILGVAAIFLRR